MKTMKTAVKPEASAAVRCFIPMVFLILMLCPPGLSANVPAGQDPESIKLDKALSQYLSSRLSTSVNVYDAGRFLIIASKNYASKVEREVGPNLLAALAEFRSLVGLSPDTPFWEGEDRCRLVLLKSRKVYRKYIEIFERKVKPDNLSPGFSEAVQEAQSFYWIEPTPYAVCCGEGAGIEEMTQHLFHLLGHILLTHYRYNYRFAPPWLHEGFGAYMAIRFAGENILFCTAGLNSLQFGTGVFKGLSSEARSRNWPAFFKKKTLDGDILSLKELALVPIDEFRHLDTALAWSFVTFLIQERRHKFKAYIDELKRQAAKSEPEGEWPPAAFAAAAFKRAFGLSMEEIEPKWREWARNGSSKPPAPLNTIPFDPAAHLEGFTEFEGPEYEEALAPFLRRSSENLGEQDLAAIRAEWDRVRRDLIEGREKRKNDRLGKETVDSKNALTALRTSKEARFLQPDEITELFWPDLAREVFYPVIRHLVVNHGCYGAWNLLCARHEGALDILKKNGFEEDLNLLEEASLVEAGIFENLAAKGVTLTLDLWPGRLKLKKAAEGELVLSGKKPKNADPALPPGYEDCTLEDKGGEVEIVCPWSRIDLKTCLNLCKIKLKLKSDEDRLGYLLLCLFRGEDKAFSGERKHIKGNEEQVQKRLRMLPPYVKAEKGADILALLSGGLARDMDKSMERFLRLWSQAEGTALREALATRGRAIVRRLLLENHIEQNAYIRTFKGFKGVQPEDGRALFIYRFDKPEEIEDFEPLPAPLLYGLKNRYKIEDDAVKDPFRVEEGSLTCNGMDGLALKPVFSGDVELILQIQLLCKEQGDGGSVFHTLFGYGLEEKGAFVASSCFTHLEIQNPARGRIQVVKAGNGDLAFKWGTTYTLVLQCGADHVVHEIREGEKKAFQIESPARGRIFLWVDGPYTFEIKEMEVRGKIDPSWIMGKVDGVVQEQLEGL